MTKARDIASAIPAPSTVSSAELGFLDGVTSAIQTQLDAKTAKSTLTTTGDIYYASAANTPARLAIGSTSDVLTVAGGIPSWAAPAGGGLVFLNKTDFTTSGTVNINNVFSTTYDNYQIIIVAKATTGTKANATIKMRVSSTDTSTNYVSERIYGTDATIGASRNERGTDEGYVGDIGTLDDTSALTINAFSPFLTKATTWIGQNFSSQDTLLVPVAFTQTDSTSFTGFTALFSTNCTGSIYSYGYAKA